jgi:hypothetical protein
LGEYVWVDLEAGKKWVRRGYCCECGQCCGDENEKCEFLRFRDESKGFVPGNCYCVAKVEGKPLKEGCADFPSEPAQCKNPSCTYYFEGVEE